MDRLFSRRADLLAVLSLLVVVVSTSGCMGPVLTAMYLFGAADVKAEYDGLKKQKVVVICHRTDLDYSNNYNADKELARSIGMNARLK